MDRLLTRPARAVAAALAAAALFAGASATAGDAAAGRSVYNNRCAQCHSAASNGPTILGPTLFGVVGRKAGTVHGFSYSSAMKASGLVWTDDRLLAYLPAPAKLVPGTKMTFAGLKSPDQLSDLIAYLGTLH